MRGQQGNALGARRRYLAEQNEHLLAIGHDPIAKRKLKPHTFAEGSPHEQYSGEAKRRRVAAAGLGWGAASAATGMAGTGLLGARSLGRPAGQAALEGVKRKYPVAAGDINRVKDISRKIATKPKTALAGAAALGATSAMTGRIASFRNNEEAGISHEIGRMKGGTQYRRDLQRIGKMSTFQAYGIAGQLASDPDVKRAAAYLYKHKKATGTLAGTTVGGIAGYQGIRRSRARRQEIATTRQALAKAEPLRTSISREDAKRLTRQYGLKGTLPKGLTREQKIAAYEARYVTAGGRRAEKWHRRAERSEKVRSAGVGAGALAGAAFLGAKAGGGRALSPLVRRTPLRHINRGHLETTGVGVGTLTAAAEVDAARARRKRSSYASAPGGVAASALRRLKAYTPEEKRG